MRQSQLTTSSQRIWMLISRCESRNPDVGGGHLGCSCRRLQHRPSLQCRRRPSSKPDRGGPFGNRHRVSQAPRHQVWGELCSDLLNTYTVAAYSNHLPVARTYITAALVAYFYIHTLYSLF